MNKPEIRFNGFQEEWKKRKLGVIANSFEYGLNAAAKEFDSQNKYIRITDIDDTTHEFLQTDLTSPDTNLNQADNYRLDEGDILFARTGASVGKTYIYKQSDGLVYYAGFLIRAQIDGKYDPQFVFQNTLTPSYKNYIRITSQRSGQPGVNVQEYAEYEFMVPSLAEQRKIGTLLRSIDTLITLNQREYEKLQIQKKSILENCFQKKEEKVPKIRFSGFTGDWEQRKLGDESLEIVAGGDVDKVKLVANGKYPVIANALTDDGIIGYYTDDYRIKAPAVTVTGRGDVGHAQARKINFTPVVRLLSVKTNHDVDFLAEAINENDVVLESTGVPQLTVPKLADYRISFPPTLEEERQIGSFFSNLDSLISLHQRELSKLQQIKKSMLQKMFVSGKA